MPYDGMEKGSLLAYDIHRRRNYPFTFYCTSCGRSFVAKERQEKCKFCQGSVKAVTGGRLNIYFCEHCDQRIESEEIRMACSTCGSQLRTLYRWDMLPSRERRRIKFAKILRSLSVPKIDIKAKKAEITEKSGNTSRTKNAENRKLKVGSKYKGEELPTDEI